MKRKILYTLSVFGLCAGITLNMHSVVYAESQAVESIAKSSEYTGWVDNDDGTKSYYKDGEMVCNAVIQIGTSYYGFDDDGIMYSDTSFSIYDEEFANKKYYRAWENGELYQNQWYEDEWTKYYYTEDGTSANGILQLDGNTYWFYEYGELVVNCSLSIEEDNFVANGEGVLIPVNNNGWIKVDDYWYYVKEGQFCKEIVEKIGTQKYCFDWAGRMLSDDYHFVWDYEQDKNVCVMAKSDGSLYKNQWIDKYDNWYYADENCYLVTGVHKVGSFTYLFNDSGIMIENAATVVNGISYAANENGIAVKLNNNNWTQVGKYWYYVKNNQYLYNTIDVIAGVSYLFDGDGRMLADSEYELFDYEEQEWHTYRAKTDGKLYKNEWYKDEHGRWYYYGSDCLPCIGVHTISGKKYYFGSYGMYVNTTIWHDDAYYYADKNGVLKKLVNNAWTYVDGAWFYVKDNYLPEGEAILIGGKYYGFDYEGKMHADETFYSYVYIGERSYYGRHRAKSDGSLCINEWYYDDEQWEYYDEKTIGLDGIHTVGGKKYCFDSGILRERGYAYADNYDAYLIGEGGVLITDKKGWYTFDGEWYYMNENGSLYSGFLKLGNNLYYLDYEMMHNSSYTVYEDTLYQAKDATGVLTKVTTDGLYIDDYSGYYVSNGKIFKGWKFIQGAWRYFDGYGVMAESYDSYYIDGCRYAFDDNGALYTNKWVNSYTYATASGAFAVGEYTIDGKKYIFDEDGQLYSSYYSENNEYVINGIKYKFNQGWNNVEGSWYYLNGKELLEGEQEIGGKKYCFDDYVMLADERTDSSYYNKNGEAVKGWFKLDGVWYYAGEDYTFEYGLTEIGGLKYYFIGGRMATDDVQEGDNIYRIGPDGVVKATDKIKDGWNYIGVRAYYYKEGNRYTGWLGNSYIEYGTKIFDSSIYDDKYEAHYYIDKDGNCVYNSWIKPYEGNDMFLYAGSDGKLKCNGWAMINGSWYYFDEYCWMETGLVVDNGVSYFLDHNGRLIKTFDKITDGWHQLDGEWLYATNGKFITDETVSINGKFYEFSYNGCMYIDSVSRRTFGADGAMRIVPGWYQRDDEWFYLGLLGGVTTSNWLEQGGKKYYLDYAMATGYTIIERELYYFDKYGAFEGKYGVANGWYQADGSWYYFINGKVVINEAIIINGKRYAFDWDGKMMTNDVYYTTDDGYYHTLYYFGADGAAVTKEGIYTTDDGAKVYVGKNGEAYIGTVYVNGKIQHMDADNNFYN